jgi:hypothetical protein
MLEVWIYDCREILDWMIDYGWMDCGWMDCGWIVDGLLRDLVDDCFRFDL